MTGQIGHHEQQIPKFLGLRLGRKLGARLDQFARFLDHLVQYLTDFRPVESHPRGPVLQLDRPCQGRQAHRHTIQNPRPRAPFARLEGLPVVGLLLGCLVAAILAEHMRVARDHLVADCAQHIFKFEKPFFFGHLRVIYHL